jgi:hypothetical protein
MKIPGTALLNKLLAKKGIDDVTTLDSEEKAVYEKYRLVLSGESVTVEMIKEFCKSQIRIIEGKCDGVQLLTPVQQGSLHVYINLLKAIEAPEAERESLEKYLTQIVNS